MLDSKEFEDVLFFKNQGVQADGSIHHAHMQLVGLKNARYQRNKIEDSLTGAIAFESEDVKVMVSDNPSSEKYEFNVMWTKDNNSHEYVSWVQNIVRYFSVFKGGKFKDYNFYYHENENARIIKLIPRGATSIYYLGYGIRQVPDDIETVAKDLYQFACR